MLSSKSTGTSSSCIEFREKVGDKEAAPVF